MKDKILIIEDEPAIADNIAYALKTEGFEPIHCPTGGEGRARLEGGGIALVVLDVGLPDTNGFEWCREVRKAHATPIIFLTARSDEVDRVVGLEIGADDYLVKPFSPRELAARVKAVLRRSAVKTQVSPIALGPFTLDEARRQVAYHGESLPLTRNEYRLMKAFLERPGRVLSRDQLMELAWDEPEASLDRTVDAHVKSLRAKLKRVNADEDPIVTHRGEGYSLKEF